jgi:hypothetical protein
MIPNVIPVSMLSAPFEKEDTTEAWKKCAEVIMDHDKARLEGWKDQLSSILVFVSLM